MIIDLELANDFNRNSFESYFGRSPRSDGELVRWVLKIMEDVKAQKKPNIRSNG